MATRIVVGVDGSPASIAALRFAAGEGELRGTGVLAVYALEVPTVPWPGLAGAIGTALEEANRVFGHAVEEAFPGAAPAVTLERRVRSDRRQRRSSTRPQTPT